MFTITWFQEEVKTLAPDKVDCEQKGAPGGVEFHETHLKKRKHLGHFTQIEQFELFAWTTLRQNFIPVARVSST